MDFKESSKLVTYHFLHHFGCCFEAAYRSVIFLSVGSPFFRIGATIPSFHLLGKVPDSTELFIILVSGILITSFPNKIPLEGLFYGCIKWPFVNTNVKKTFIFIYYARIKKNIQVSDVVKEKTFIIYKWISSEGLPIYFSLVRVCKVHS